MSLGSSGNATIRRPQDVYYGAESTVSRSLLSILTTVLGTVMGRVRVQVDGAEHLLVGRSGRTNLMLNSD